jgi:enterochelin esterase-like enzyme
MTRCAILALLPLLASAQDYKLGPDSQRQPNVPRGRVEKFSWTSKIYPATTRDYWVYVPSQYQPGRPAALMVFQDGAGFVAEDGAWRVPVVFDNLINRGEIPVTIGVFIDPGILPPGHANRSYEYDSVTDKYSRFLLNEILPHVEKTYNISRDPNQRAIGGSSSGGICAFTVAWNRPDSFRRVLSFVGSFVNLRGGEIYSSLIRKTEPKPLRVFLQDGENDLNIAAGNWFIGAHDMLSALEYAGYDVTHVWGVEGHNSKHGGAILPDSLRWLWRGYPSPIAKPKGGGLREWSTLLTDPNSDWEPASQGPHSTAGPYQADPAHKAIVKLENGTRRVVYQAAWSPSSVLLTRDHKFLLATAPASRNIWWFQVLPDGSLANGDAIYRLETPDESSATGASGMVFDSEDFLYVATNMGIQVFDPAGRVMAILTPPTSSPLTSVAIGGDILYVTAGDKIFRRAMKHK